MPPSQEEAAKALREISHVQERAAGFLDYRGEAGQLILWGVLNAMGCMAIALWPAYPLRIWLCVVIVGMTLGSWLVHRACEGRRDIVWRYLLVICCILLFDLLLHVIMWPLTLRQSSLIVPLFIAALYVIRGAQSRPRYIVIGTLLAVLCTCCYLFSLNNYWWWLALAWGGTFVLSGGWLRRG